VITIGEGTLNAINRRCKLLHVEIDGRLCVFERTVYRRCRRLLLGCLIRFEV
jgi:hypothetical protein